MKNKRILHNYDKFQTMQIFNHVLMAYFLNEASNSGVDFYNSRPTEPRIKSIASQCYFVPTDTIPELKFFYHGKLLLPELDIDFLSHNHLDDFMDDQKRKIVTDLAQDFASIVNQHPYSDFIFSNLPDYAPYLTVFDSDTDTNFRARFIVGHNFGDNKMMGIFEFYCLIINRIRIIEDTDLYGSVYMGVEKMSPEDRIKYDIQPEPRNYDE